MLLLDQVGIFNLRFEEFNLHFARLDILLVGLELFAGFSDLFFHLVKLVHEALNLIAEPLDILTSSLELLLVLVDFLHTLDDALLQRALDLGLHNLHLGLVFLHLGLILGLLLFEPINRLVNTSAQVVVLLDFGDPFLFLRVEVVIYGGHFVLTLIGKLLAIGALFVHRRLVLQVKIMVLLEHCVAQVA